MTSRNYTTDELAQITNLANQKFQAGWLTVFPDLDNAPSIGIGMAECVLEALGEWEAGQKGEPEAGKDG